MLGLLFGFSVIVVVMVGLLAIPYPSLRTDQTPLALPVQIAFYGCLYLSFRMVLGLRYHKSVFSSLGWCRSQINLAWMAGGGIVLAFVLSALGDLFKTPKVALPFEKLTNTPASLTFFAIVAIVLAPFFEELFSWIHPATAFANLRNRGGRTYNGDILWALHGFEYSWVWQYALFISLAGAVFGFLRARTNSIIPSTVMHGCFNAVSVVALAFGKNI